MGNERDLTCQQTVKEIAEEVGQVHKTAMEIVGTEDVEAIRIGARLGKRGRHQVGWAIEYCPRWGAGFTVEAPALRSCLSKLKKEVG